MSLDQWKAAARASLAFYLGRNLSEEETAESDSFVVALVAPR